MTLGILDNLYGFLFSNKVEVGAGQKGYGYFGNDLLIGHNGALLLDGGWGNDLFVTDGYVAKIDGGKGCDTLKIVGTEGFDAAGHVGDIQNIEKVVVDAGLSVVSFSRYAPQDCKPTGLDITVADKLVNGVYLGANIIASEYSDSLTGGRGADRLVGNKGDDLIHGGDGDDLIEGGIGKDKLYGDAGNDRFIVNSGPDQQPDCLVDGGAGIDSINLNEQIFTADLTLDFRNPGVAKVIAGTRIVNVEVLDYNGSQGADKVIGGDFADKINGNLGNDVIQGGGGNDLLFGGDGSDTAVYTGKLADYAFAKSGAGFTVSDTRGGTPDGVDSLQGFELLKFSDTTVAVSSIGV